MERSGKKCYWCSRTPVAGEKLFEVVDGYKKKRNLCYDDRRTFKIMRAIKYHSTQVHDCLLFHPDVKKILWDCIGRVVDYPTGDKCQKIEHQAREEGFYPRTEVVKISDFFESILRFPTQALDAQGHVLSWASAKTSVRLLPYSIPVDADAECRVCGTEFLSKGGQLCSFCSMQKRGFSLLREFMKIHAGMVLVSKHVYDYFIECRDVSRFPGKEFRRNAADMDVPDKHKKMYDLESVICDTFVPVAIWANSKGSHLNEDFEEIGRILTGGNLVFSERGK